MDEPRHVIVIYECIHGNLTNKGDYCGFGSSVREYSPGTVVPCSRPHI